VRQKYDTSVFACISLSNGIPVYTQRPPILTDERCKITVCLPQIGSCADPPAAPGTAHFCEHAPLLGTPSWPHAVAVLRTPRDDGGDINANVGVERTVFFVTGARDDLPRNLKLLGELITCPLLDEEQLTEERSTIIREYHDRADDPKSIRDGHFRRHFYRDHPFGHPPIGELTIIETMTPAAIHQFMGTHYHAGNLAVIGTGDLPTDAELISLLEVAFGQLPYREPFHILAPTYPAGGSSVEIREPQLKSDFLMLIYPMSKPSAKIQCAFSALANCLGSGPDSPMAIELRHNRRWAYQTTFADFIVSRHDGMFRLALKLSAVHFATATDVTMELLNHMHEDRWAQVKRRMQLRRRLTFIDPVGASGRVVAALVNDQKLRTIRESEAITDSLEWADLETCRRQLLAAQPIVMRILAG